MKFCNILNVYFTNVGTTIKNNIKSSYYNFKSFEYLNWKCDISDSIFINPINNVEIENLLKTIEDHS